MQTARDYCLLVALTSALSLEGCSSSDPWLPPPEEGSDCVLGQPGCAEMDDEAGGETQDAICFVNDIEGRSGVRHQCLGAIDFFIEFDLTNVGGAQNCADAQGLLDNEPLCHEYHEFGQEAYDKAVVGACCEDFGDDVSAPAVLANCAADLANQVCLTFLNRMIHHREWKHFGNGDLDEQAGNIISYLAYNINECTGELLQNDADESPEVIDSSYALPNDAESWPLWHDFVLSVDMGIIDAYTLPADDVGLLACETIKENDTNVFPGQWPGADGASKPGVLVDAGSVTLLGPTILGDTVRARALLGAASEGCAGPNCSSVEFVVGADGLVWLAQLDLPVDGGVAVGNQLGTLEFSDVRVELDRPVLALRAMNGRYTIATGEAGFWVSGVRVDDRSVGARVFLALTSTIDFGYDSREGVWTMSPFTLGYHHFSGQDWEVDVAATRWR